MNSRLAQSQANRLKTNALGPQDITMSFNHIYGNSYQSETINSSRQFVLEFIFNSIPPQPVSATTTSTHSHHTTRPSPFNHSQHPHMSSLVIPMCTSLPNCWAIINSYACGVRRALDLIRGPTAPLQHRQQTTHQHFLRDAIRYAETNLIRARTSTLLTHTTVLQRKCKSASSALRCLY